MDKRERLSNLSKQIEICKKCPLYKEATRAVPGEGSPEGKIVFIGEAPGFHEDAQGRPFVGSAGKHLDFLLAKVGLKREEVFITNVVKHRPPENRDPAPMEIAACSGWLEAQLAAISPKVVVTLGRWSMSRYVSGAKISTVHGKPFYTQGVVVLPMYHPAAALRSGQMARQLEEDFLTNQTLFSDPDRAGDLVEDAKETKQVSVSDGQGSLF
jgi:DNA polymerase